MALAFTTQFCYAFGVLPNLFVTGVLVPMLCCSATVKARVGLVSVLPPKHHMPSGMGRVGVVVVGSGQGGLE